MTTRPSSNLSESTRVIFTLRNVPDGKLPLTDTTGSGPMGYEIVYPGGCLTGSAKGQGR